MQKHDLSVASQDELDQLKNELKEDFKQRVQKVKFDDFIFIQKKIQFKKNMRQNIMSECFRTQPREIRRRAPSEQEIRVRQLFKDSDFAAEDIDENSGCKNSKVPSLMRSSIPKKVEKYPDFGLDVTERQPAKRTASEPLATALAELRQTRERQMRLEVLPSYSAQVAAFSISSIQEESSESVSDSEIGVRDSTCS